MTQLESTLEAVLFAAGDAVPLDRLCAALETPREDILAAAGALEALYDLENRGLMLRRIEDRLQLCSRPMYAEAARRVTESRRAAALCVRAILRRFLHAVCLPLARLFDGARSRSEIVATFLAVLELSRTHRIRLHGEGEDIELTLNDEKGSETRDTTGEHA